MATKTDLRDASAELKAALDKIEEIAGEYPSLMVYTKGDDGKVEFGESFSSIVEMFTKRADYFRRQLVKIEDVMPKSKTRRRNGTDK